MPSKSDVELARYMLVKVIRDQTRLKYSLLADKELNQTLPQRLAEFDRMVQEGTLPDVYLMVDSNVVTGS